MKRLAYGVVIVAGLMFIANWVFENYTAFQWARRGTADVDAAVTADAGTTLFPTCDAQWGRNAMMVRACNEQTAAGYQSFSQAWFNSPSTASRLTMINCWQSFHQLSGTNWVLAGPCAQSAAAVH